MSQSSSHRSQRPVGAMLCDHMNARAAVRASGTSVFDGMFTAIGQFLAGLRTRAGHAQRGERPRASKASSCQAT